MKKLALTIFTLFLLSSNAFALVCHGTEPFWSAKLEKDSITMDLVPEKKTLAVTSISGAAGYVESFIQVYSDNRGPLAIVKKAECDDGMSDDTFSQEVILFTGSSTLYGCCGEPVQAQE